MPSTEEMSPGVAALLHDEVRFSVGLRGYRMDEVDALLDEVRAELLRLQTASVQHPPNESDEPEQDASTQTGAHHA